VKSETGSKAGWKRIFRTRDSRINTGYMSIKEYLLLFFAVAAINGIHMMIYVAFVDRGMVESHVQLVINVLR
jgi:hypothetical protein